MSCRSSSLSKPLHSRMNCAYGFVPDSSPFFPASPAWSIFSRPSRHVYNRSWSWYERMLQRGSRHPRLTKYLHPDGKHAFQRIKSNVVNQSTEDTLWAQDRTYWICSLEALDAAFDKAQAASFFISDSDVFRRTTRGLIMFASITACWKDYEPKDNNEFRYRI